MKKATVLGLLHLEYFCYATDNLGSSLDTRTIFLLGLTFMRSKHNLEFLFVQKCIY